MISKADDRDLTIKRLQTAYENLISKGVKLKSFNNLFTSIGMTHGNASTYATGKKGLGHETINKLHDKFGINPNYIKHGEGEPLISVIEEPRSEYHKNDVLQKLIKYEAELKNREELIEALKQIIIEKERVIQLLENKK